MRLITGRNHADFNLDGGMSQGPKYMVRPAKDPIARAPEDEQINILLRTTLCRARAHEGTWEITGVSGAVKCVEYSASYETWSLTCRELLKIAINEDIRGES